VIQNVRWVCSIKMSVVMLGVLASQSDDFIVSVLYQSAVGVHCCGEPVVARLRLIQACIGCFVKFGAT